MDFFRSFLWMSHFLIFAATAKEYCMDETLNVECGLDEVILVESARYGRMRLGRCVRTDYGYIGCGYDVTGILAGKCSGRRHCRIFNMEAFFASDKPKPCPEELKSYLNATIKCIKVAFPAKSATCPDVGLSPAHTTHTTSGYFASVTSYEMTGVGGSICPWLIETAPGQRINLTLLDFADNVPQLPALRDPKQSITRLETRKRDCTEFAVVSEGGVGAEPRSLVKCQGDPKTRLVYSSRANKVKILLTPVETSGDENEHYFVLKYEVFGCSYPRIHGNEFIVPEGNGDVIRIYCNDTSKPKRFTTARCLEGRWTGNWQSNNCSDDFSENAAMETYSFLTYGMSVILIGVIAMCICVTVLTIGLFGLHRFNRSRRTKLDRQSSIIRSNMVAAQMSTDTIQKPMTSTTSTSGGGTLSRHQMIPFYDYAIAPGAAFMAQAPSAQSPMAQTFMVQAASAQSPRLVRSAISNSRSSCLTEIEPDMIRCTCARPPPVAVRDCVLTEAEIQDRMDIIQRAASAGCFQLSTFSTFKPNAGNVGPMEHDQCTAELANR